MRARRARLALVCAAVAMLGACGPGEPVWAPDDVVQRAAYRHDGPPAITLFTMKNTSSDNGAHTGLMINGSQRVIFDPAGTFGHASFPERNDVHFGITPRVRDFYVTYHARETYYVQEQRIEVSPEVAEQALRLVQQAGPVPKAACTRETAAVLQQLPGFESISRTLFPNRLADDFARLPGVTEVIHREDDPDDKTLARAAFDAEISPEEP